MCCQYLLHSQHACAVSMHVHDSMSCSCYTSNTYLQADMRVIPTWTAPWHVLAAMDSYVWQLCVKPALFNQHPCLRQHGSTLLQCATGGLPPCSTRTHADISPPMPAHYCTSCIQKYTCAPHWQHMHVAKRLRSPLSTALHASPGPAAHACSGLEQKPGALSTKQLCTPSAPTRSTCPNTCPALKTHAGVYCRQASLHGRDSQATETLNTKNH
jgi:hypothetical protein